MPVRSRWWLSLGLVGTAWAGTPDKVEVAPAPAAASVEVLPSVAATPTTWPHWRGNAAQTGVAPGALDLASLTTRWVHRAEDPIVAPAVVDAKRVIVGTKGGAILALDRATGAPLWSVQTEGAVEAPALLVNGLAIVGSRDGLVRALDTADGTLRWSVDLEAEITAGAAWVPASGAHGAAVVIGDYAGKLHRLDVSTGKAAWTYATGSYIYGTPAIAGTNAVVGGCDGFVHTVALADGAAVSKLPVEAYVGGSVAVEGELGWVGHFAHKIIGFHTTKPEVRWSVFERSFPYLSSPAVKGEMVVLGGRDRVVHALDKRTGDPLWWFPARGKVDSSPVIVGNHVVVGSHDGRLYAIDAGTGEQARAFDVGAAISASPAVASGWVYVGAEDGTLHAFGPKGEAKDGKPSRKRKKGASDG